MSESILKAALVLAYGPFLVMALLYVAGLVLKIGGSPDLLRSLTERTRIPKPIPRGTARSG